MITHRTVSFLPILALLLTFLSRADVKATGAAGQLLDPDTGITLAEGFDAELLYSVPSSQGSWVAMTFDPKGRIIVSDQDDKGVFRVTLPSEGEAASGIAVESLKGFPYEPIEWGERMVGGRAWVSVCLRQPVHVLNEGSLPDPGHGR